MKNILSPALYGIIIICFFLPWVSVSCQGQPIITLSGFQLAKGTTFGQPGTGPQKIAPQKETKKVNPEIFALLSVIVAAGGLASCFLKGKAGTILPAAGGILGVIFLVLMRFKLSRELSKVGEGAGILQLEYGIGYYLTFLLFLASFVLNIYNPFKKPLQKEITTKGTPLKKFCTQCGQENEGGNQFCSSCGAKLV